MKIIHKYILLNFIKVFTFSLLLSLLLFYIADFFGSISTVIQNSVNILSVIEYYIYYTPVIIYWSLPIIVALSSLIALGFLSMRNETIVMRSSGINIFKISFSITVFSIFAAIFMFVSDEFIINKAANKVAYIKKFQIDKDYGSVWSKKGQFFINISRLHKDKAKNIKIYKISKDDRIIKVISANEGIVGKDKLVLYGVNETNLVGMFNKVHKTNLILNIKLKPEDFVLSDKELSMPSFSRLIKDMKAYPSESYYYRASIIFKLMYPFSSVILTIISLIFVLKITPRKSDFIKNVFLGGLIFTAYLGMLVVLTSMGKADIMPPVVSILIFVLFSIIITLYNIIKLGV